MTVINPNSVAGINSITVQSGNSLSVHKSNGELIRTLTSSSGVSTFSSLSVGTATTDNSAAKSINIGLGASIAQHNNNTLSFGTGGDERIVIDASGNVSIGGGTHTRNLAVHSATNSVILIEGNSDATSNLMFGDQNDEDIGMLQYSHANNSLAFTVNASERLRIQSDGDVGIGTIDNSNNERLRIQDDASTSTTCQVSIISGNAERAILNFGDAEDPNIGRVSYHNNTNTLSFFTDNSERLSIDSTGAIVKQLFTATNTYAANDTTQCGYQSQNLSDTTNTYSALRLTAGNSSPATAQLSSIRTGAGPNDFTIQLESSNTAFEALRVTSAGKMGIGNNSPSFILDLKGATADTLRLTNSGETTHGSHDTKLVSGGSYYSNFDFQASIYKIQTYNGSSLGERFRVASAGQLGIGGANYGTSGQVLTSQGSSSAPTWGSAGGIVPITATTVSSDTSAVAFTEALTGAFDTYKIYIVMIDGLKFAADDRDLRVRYRTGSNGGTLASGSDYHSMTNGANNADDAFSANNFWRMNYNNISNVTVGSYIKGDFNAIIYFQGFEANRRLRYYGMTSYQSADGDDRGQFISGMATDATEATGLEFFSSSGDIALGKFSLFGVNG